MVRTQQTLIAALFVILPLAAATASADVFVGVKTSGRKSLDAIDHKPWGTILKKYVDKNGMVNYRALKASSTDMRTLNGYLNSLSSANPKLKTSKAGKLAFWINAYNAVTIHGILKEYPTSSIRNHTAKIFGYNIWKNLLLYVGGQPYSLDDMEHKILRKMNEPRIHFAVVCASIGCPRLLNQAYTVKGVDQQLEVNAKDFFSRRQNFRFDGRSFQLSSLLDWYGSDFGASSSVQLKRYSRWMPTDQSRKAAAKGTGSISYLDYNWQLNQQPGRGTIAKQ